MPEIGEKQLFDLCGRNKYIVIDVYTPWCYYCKKSMPKVERAAVILMSKRSDILFFTLNYESNYLAEFLGVDSFPKLAVFDAFNCKPSISSFSLNETSVYDFFADLPKFKDDLHSKHKYFNYDNYFTTANDWKRRDDEKAAANRKK